MIAPARVRGRAAPALVRAIDHIIVNERGAVEQLDDGGKLNRTWAAMTGVARGQQEERRAQALASATQKIGRDFGDRLEGGDALPRQFLFDEHEVISDEIKNLPGC